MKTTTIKGTTISCMSLGTAQLGYHYGISNKTGKPDRKVAHEILNHALQCGVNCFDTAAAYGDAEEVIGEWLSTLSPVKQPLVVTKVANLDHSSLSALREDMQRQVALAKRKLGVRQIPMLMLHHFDEYLADADNMDIVFQELKQNGDICLSGVSAYSQHDYKEIAETDFDAVQIPLNIFDNTHVENGELNKLYEAGKIIFVRSVYLQGLVFQDPDHLKPEMEFCRGALVKFRGLCKRWNLSPATLSIAYVLSLPGITSLVLGSETVEQLEENLKLIKDAPTLTAKQIEEIHKTFYNIETRVINPSQW